MPVIRYTVAGTYTWNSGNNSVVGLKLTGAGGGSSSGTPPALAGCPGGGGGASVIETAYAVTPFTDYTLNIGAGGIRGAAGGDTWFITSGTLLAKGGGFATGDSSGVNAGGTGGSAASSIGTTKFNGGNGGTPAPGVVDPSVGGGGGSSGGTAANGRNGANGISNGIPALGGVAPPGGGDGGYSSASGVSAAQNGQSPGGGGGGITDTHTSNGIGSDGSIEISAGDDVWYVPQRVPNQVGPQVQRIGKYKAKYPPIAWVDVRQKTNTTFIFPQVIPPNRNVGPTAARRIKTPPPIYVDLRQTKTSEFGYRNTFPNNRVGPQVLRRSRRAPYLPPDSPIVLTPIVVTPDPLLMTWTGYAPTVSTPVTVIPDTLALVWTGYAPTVSTPVAVTPDTLALVWTGFSPTVTTSSSSDTTVTPGTLALVLSGYAPTVVVAPIPHPLTGNFYWGRFSRGQYVNVILNIDLLPDDSAPIAAMWLNGATLIEEIELPRVRAANTVFRLTKLLDNQYTDGQYIAAIRFIAGGNTYCSVGYFQVSGGSGYAPLIAVSEIDRTAGRAVVSQDSTGFMKMGYKPKKDLS